MFHSISWQQYIFWLLICMLAYYLFIWVAVYGASTSIFRRLIPSPAIPGQPHTALQDDSHTTDHEALAIAIMAELKQEFSNKSNKAELILALQLGLRKYRNWNIPGFRNELNSMISYESQEKCSIRLSEDDLAALWL